MTCPHLERYENGKFNGEPIHRCSSCGMTFVEPWHIASMKDRGGHSILEPTPQLIDVDLDTITSKGEEA